MAQTWFSSANCIKTFVRLVFCLRIRTGNLQRSPDPIRRGEEGEGSKEKEMETEIVRRAFPRFNIYMQLYSSNDSTKIITNN